MRVSIRSKTIKKHLARKNLSQNWLALRVGTTSGYMSQLLRGIRTPSPEMRQKILDALKDYAFDDLFVIKGR